MGRDKPHPHLISFPACASLPPICPSIFLHPPTLHMHPTLFFLAGSAARMSDMAAHIQSSDCYERSQGMRVGDVQCSAIPPWRSCPQPGLRMGVLMLQRGRFSPAASHPYRQARLLGRGENQRAPWPPPHPSSHLLRTIHSESIDVNVKS